MKTDYTPETGDEEQKVLDLARDRRTQCETAESTTRAEGDEDLKFAAGDQWPEDAKRMRQFEGGGQRPCLTFNKTGQFVRQVVNDNKQNSPAIKVFPVGDGADTKRAEILNGMIRDVEERTDAKSAYDTALESAARTGEGYFRLITDYVHPEHGFEQELKFQRIRNINSSHPDPAALCPAGSDAKFWFVDQWMTEEEFKAEYGADKMQSLESVSLGESEPSWMKTGSVLVADYYSLEDDQPRTLVMLKNGSIVVKEEYSEELSEDDIVSERNIKTTRCIIRKITGGNVLEKTVFPCHYIPVFRVIGEEFEIDGEIIFKGLIRDMKDSLRAYNYWMSNATEKGALETKAPYIGAEGQFEGHEHKWKNANKTPFAYLEYKPVDVEGNLSPPPQRNQTSFAGAADVEMAKFVGEETKSIVGIHSAGLGETSNEKSGRAIIARQRESDTGTFHYTDNLAKAMKQCARVLVEVLPKYVNTDRMVRILGEDGSDSMERVNYREEKVDEESGNKIMESVNDITVGRYDVSVSVGPSYTTRRLESADSMMAFVQAVPAAGQAIMDLLAKSMDWPGADEIAKRLRKMVPGALLDDEEDGALTQTKVDGMIQEVVANMEQQFAASMEQREVEVKEYEAETKRLDTAMSNMPDEDKIREIVSDAMAEMVSQLAGGGE